jgi:hypothetical protein
LQQAGSTNRGTPLLRATSDPGTTIASLPTGTLLNLLKVPDSSGEQWLLVQPIVKKKALIWGYVKWDSVRDWSNPDAALILAGHGDLQRQIEAFHRVAVRFPNAPQARTATIKEARLLLELSKQEKSDGRPDEEWRRHAQQALSLLESLSPDQETVLLSEALKAILLRPEPVPDPRDLADLTKARELLNRYDCGGARLIVHNLLTRNPDNSDSTALKKRIEIQEGAENGPQH